MSELEIVDQSKEGNYYTNGKLHKYSEEGKENTALVVFCKKPMYVKSKEKKLKPELQQFTIKLKEKYDTKYKGYAFVKEDGVSGADTY